MIAVNETFLAMVAAGCLVATYVWTRSSLRLGRAASRIEQGVQAGLHGSEASALAWSAFRKEAHTAALYAILTLLAGLSALPDHPALDVPFLALFVPIGITLIYGPRFLSEASAVEDRSRLERRAEELLEQHDLAPQLWAKRLAPDDLPDIEGFEVASVYEAGTGVMAGDFYDVVQLSPTRLAVLIGDVSGHGIEPSITAFQVKYLLRVFLRQYRDPAQALEEMNDLLSSQTRGDEFVSVCVVVFDTEAATLRHASAGHPAAWLWHDGEVRALRSTGPLLSIDPNASYTSREVELRSGDVLMLYTDGLSEARHGEQLFGEDRAAGVLRRDPGQDAESLCKSVLEAARDFAAAPLSDDVAILAIRRT